MKRLFTVTLALVLVAGSVPAAANLFPAHATDQVDETELLDEVTIVRDAHGVPHVYADSQKALWYANGYAQAEDRLWAMDLLRHISYGEASSVVGPGGGILEMDVQNTRDLYTEDELEAMHASSPAWFQDALEAFSDGVNRAAAEMHATGDLPAEFGALQHAYHPWEPLDTVAVASFLLAEFGTGGGAEVTNADLLATLDETFDEDEAAWNAFEDLVPVRHEDTYTTIAGPAYDETPQSDPPDDREDLPPAQREATLAAADAMPFGLDADSPVPDVGLFQGEQVNLRWGSNALLVSPGFSSTDQALLGGGPQMGYFNPQVPYEVGLHGPEITAEGMGITGAPGIIIGHNGQMAWTVTSGISDQTDIVALPATDERAYAWDDEEHELDCRTEHHVLFTPPALYADRVGERPADVLEQEVCTSHVGPVIAITHDDDGDPAYFFAKHTSSRALEIDSGAAWLSLATTSNTDELHEHLDDFAFTFNFHVAGQNEDGDETICYLHVGHQPERAPSLDPRLPTPAGDDWGWQGTLSGDQLPHECDPGRGYYANWNNAPQNRWASGDAREQWGQVHRAERLDQSFHQHLGDAQGSLDLDDVEDILEHATTHHSLAPGIVPTLLENAPGNAPAATAALEAWQDDDYSWDATDGTYDHAGMTVFEDVMEELLALVFDDALQDHAHDVEWSPLNHSDVHAADHGTSTNKFALLMDAFDGATNVDWCSLGSDDCQHALEQAYENSGLADHDSVDEIPDTDEHESEFTALGLGTAYRIPMMNKATYSHFHVGSDATESYATLPPGASGHVNPTEALLLLGMGEEPQHMGDQLDAYVNHEHKPVPIQDAAAWEQQGDTTHLIVP